MDGGSTPRGTGDLEALVAELGAAGLDPHALVVVRDGREILRASWAPYRADEPALVYSVSKTLTSLAVGCLVADGVLDLDTGVEAWLPAPNPHRWTLRDLLTMSTGHSREQTLTLPFDAAAYLAARPDQPRGTFTYSSPATFVLAEIVRAVTGDDLTSLLRSRLLDALEIDRIWWARIAGAAGRGVEQGQVERGQVEQGYSGLHIAATDLARLGRLLLADGVWQGHHLLPAPYLAELSRPQVPTAPPGTADERTDDWGLGYGFQTWRSRHGYRMDGAYGQFLLIVPDRDLVIAYQGATTTTQATLDLLWSYVESVPPRTCPEPGAAREPGDGNALVLEGDSWANRDALVPATGPDLDVTGWELSTAAGAAGAGELAPRAAGPGSLLTLRLTAPNGGTVSARIPVGTDRWERSVVDATTSVVDATTDVVVTTTGAADRSDEPTRLVLAARGERRADGTHLVQLVVPTSPHRILLDQPPGGPLRARWHTAPLWHPDLSTLLTPATLTRQLEEPRP